MKQALIWVMIWAGLAGGGLANCRGADAGTAAAPAATGATTTTTATTTNAPAADPALNYATIYKQEIELSARFKLLRELADEHVKRADEASRTNQPERFKWETEWANDLKARAMEGASQADAATRQRLSLEEKEKPAATAVLLSADETAYLSKLDSTLWQIEQEVQTALEASRGFSAQLLTNNTPEDMMRISFQVQDNNRVLKFLERDRTLLELQKLEYRAIRKK